MGGVISLYAALTYPDKIAAVFGISNAFWVSLDPILKVIHDFQGVLPKIYLDLGKCESSDPVEMKLIASAEAQIEGALRTKKPFELRSESIENGVHNEGSWRLRIEEILRWILPK